MNGPPQPNTPPHSHMQLQNYHPSGFILGDKLFYKLGCFWQEHGLGTNIILKIAIGDYKYFFITSFF